MDIQREKLLEIVEDALAASGIGEEAASRIRFAAETAPRLARGCWSVTLEDGECYCPLQEAGVFHVPLEDEEDFQEVFHVSEARAHRFTEVYDRGARKHADVAAPQERAESGWEQVLFIHD